MNIPVTKERDSAPFFLGASDVFAFCFAGKCHVEEQRGQKEGSGNESELYGMFPDGNWRPTVLESRSNNSCDNINENFYGGIISCCESRLNNRGRRRRRIWMASRRSRCHEECKKKNPS